MYFCSNSYVGSSIDSLSDKTMLDISTQSGCTVSASASPVLTDNPEAALLVLLQRIKYDLNPQRHVKDAVT
jgi:hypothetical protein